MSPAFPEVRRNRMVSSKGMRPMNKSLRETAVVDPSPPDQRPGMP